MKNKKYGEYGGQYVAESLMNTLKELETALTLIVYLNRKGDED